MIDPFGRKPRAKPNVINERVQPASSRGCKFGLTQFDGSYAQIVFWHTGGLRLASRARG